MWVKNGTSKLISNYFFLSGENKTFRFKPTEYATKLRNKLQHLSSTKRGRFKSKPLKRLFVLSWCVEAGILLMIKKSLRLVFVAGPSISDVVGNRRF